jgi:putative hydrolase of the HAD superfamily
LQNVKHIFFDLDHTLWDFERNSKEALNDIFDEKNLQQKGVPTFEDFFTTYKKLNAHYWELYRIGELPKEILRTIRFEKTLEAFGINDFNLSEKIGEDYVRISPQKTHLFPHSLEVLEHLKNQQMELHIITNGFSEVQFIKLEKSGLMPFFSEVITSENAGVKKPDPQIFHYSMSLAKTIAQESLMIGDEPEIDVKGALDVGMKALVFNPKQDKQHDYDEITCLSDLKKFF